MRNAILPILLATIGMGSACALAVTWQDSEREVRQVERVRRPRFTDRDWMGIYYRDLFKDGLVGSRPERIAGPTSVAAQPPESDPATDTASGWSALTPAFVIEDEVKKLQRDLAEQITSPVRFRSEYGVARQSFEMLSLLFGIIREYDGEIRWKDDAGLAQATFARSAANARVGSQPAFQSAQRSLEALTAMVRGGKFESSEEVPEDLEWPLVVERGSVMIRLEASIEKIRPAVANKGEFEDRLEEIEHEAALIAVIGEILLKEGMDEAEEEDYAVHARLMRDSARKLVAAARDNQFEAATAPYNSLSQSCSDCHQEWR